jgi:hypothetical protein
MHIIIGDLVLRSGPNDFVISDKEPFISKKGIKTYYNATYYPTIESALNNVLKRRLLKSDATTLTELRNELLAHRQELSEIFKEIITTNPEPKEKE